MEEHYKSYHIDIYNYFVFIKENQNISDENISDAINFVLSKICKSKYPTYIIDFFKDINTKIEEDDDYSYINNFETFNIKLNKKLNINLKKYFDI